MAYADPSAGARREDYAEVAIVNLTAAVVDVGAAFSTLNDNFADLAAKINAILVELRKAGIVL